MSTAIRVITPTGDVRPHVPYRIDDGTSALRPGTVTVELTVHHPLAVTFPDFGFVLVRVPDQVDVGNFAMTF